MSTSDHQAIDWEAVYKSLDWDSSQRREDEDRRRLELRAQQYAQTLDQSQSASAETLTVLAFRLGSDRYAVEVMAVRGVRQVRKIVRVPGVPRFYRGVVNVRGQIITVLDLRLLYESGAAVTADDSARELVIVRSNTLELGLLAAHVEGVTAIPREALHAVEDVRYVLGVTVERLILLDIERMLADRRLIVQSDGRGE